MASTLEFVTYVTDQLALAGTITWKRMFGEVGLYCDQVFFAVICDDQLFIKITPEVAARIPDCPKAPPYPGAKESQSNLRRFAETQTPAAENFES